jgi:hypothetical protein
VTETVFPLFYARLIAPIRRFFSYSGIEADGLMSFGKGQGAGDEAKGFFP